MPLSGLILLIACGDDGSKVADPADTSGSADSADTGETNDTSDSSDTSTGDTGETNDTSTGDTGDTDEPLPECDLLTPYRGCTADVTSELYGLNYYVTTWDADGRISSDDYYYEEAHTTFAGRTAYLYTDGRLSSVERTDPSGNVWSRFTYTYDDAGNLTQFYDGTFRTTYRYDDEGRVVYRSQQTTTMPLVCTWSWTTTATGADFDEECMGYRASGSVDTRGLETFRIYYDLTSGEPATEATKVWRTDCQPVSETFEYLLSEGGRSTTYAYDAEDRQTEIVSETTRSVSTYTCPG
jgi:YD repeat-containing protein